MAVIVETLMAEDLELGTSTTSKTHPAGGTLNGTQISLSTFAVNAAATTASNPTWYLNDGATVATEVADRGMVCALLTVAGADLSDKVLASFSTLALLGLGISAYVSAANTVRVILLNLTGSAVTLPTTGTLSVLVFKHR